jgi:hypothetical protein
MKMKMQPKIPKSTKQLWTGSYLTVGPCHINQKNSGFALLRGQL